MVDDYYLMPNDIKLVNSNKNTATKFLSHHIGHLTTNNISVLSNKNKYDQLEVLENINFHNYKKTKSWTNNLANINERITNIFDSNLKSTILPKKSPILMGIVNITEDSFYDGGKYNTTAKALSRAYELVEEGADIIDIGAESTRPGAKPINLEYEKEKLAPIIKNLIKK